MAESSPSIANIESVSAALCQGAPVQALNKQKLLWLCAGPDQAHDVSMVQPHQQAHLKLQFLRVHVEQEKMGEQARSANTHIFISGTRRSKCFFCNCRQDVRVVGHRSAVVAANLESGSFFFFGEVF